MTVEKHPIKISQSITKITINFGRAKGHSFFERQEAKFKNDHTILSDDF